MDGLGGLPFEVVYLDKFPEPKRDKFLAAAVSEADLP